MKIRTRVAGVITGTAMVGITAFALGTATPAGAAQQTQNTRPAAVASAQATVSQGWGCWGDDCGWWDDDDDWGWDGGWGWGW